MVPEVHRGASMKDDSALCLRVARRLSERDGHGEVVTFVEEDASERTAGAPPGTKFVDLTTDSEDGTSMALEHTTIESYEQQLHEARQIEALLLPLQDRLAGELPATSRFELAVGYGAVFERSLEPDTVLSSVEPWIRTVAPTLEEGSPATAPRHSASSGPPEIAVELKLVRWPPLAAAPGGSLRVLRSQASDHDAQFARRVQRLERALDEKLIKFARYGARSVLVLEDVDVATSNLAEVRSALAVAASGRQLCDTIVVVETGVGAQAAVVVYENGRWTDRDERFPL